MSRFDEALAKQSDAAAHRVAERAGTRGEKIETLGRPGGIVLADAPARIASRIDRLARYRPDIRPIDPAAIAARDKGAMFAAEKVLERVILTKDFLGVSYLDAGAGTAKGVGRVNIRDAQNQVVGYGTGSLVSPELLLTNHHVLPDAQAASFSRIEFNYQDGVDGRPLQVVAFPLDPQRFFLADEELDYALVAVRAGELELQQFGYRRLIESEGKAIVGDFVTIVQHPKGEKKQVALRENRIVDVLDDFLHYMTDTEPGSSGSPVYNDQWEMVALHHASVPAPEHTDLGSVVNEGIRVSRLVKRIREQSGNLSSAQQALLAGLGLEGAAPVPPPPPGQPSGSVPVAGAQAIRVTVPLEITVSASDGGSIVAPAGRVAEKITIDPDYAARKGYDPEFLGAGDLRVPLPELPEDLVPLAALNRQATGQPRYLLPYHHFTLVLNKERRLAFFTAVNIDGASSYRLKREPDKWVFDPRVPEDEQTGDAAYRDNPLDRGHLVRRLDPAWGPSREAAKICNDDTFHFTNCTPQHEDFNQNKSTWAGLEDYILENADNRDFKVTVFTGPVLAPDDEEFAGVRLPRQFWKVVVMVKESGELSATAYLLSQDELIKGLEFSPEAFSYGAYKTYQVPVRRIDELTLLSFGSLSDYDPAGRLEAAVVPREIERHEQILL